MEEHVLADAKSQGNIAFAKGDFLAATCLYKVVKLQPDLNYFLV
jgi:hypothetical protein